MNNRTDKKQDWRSDDSTANRSQGRDASIPQTDQRTGNKPATDTTGRASESLKNRDQNSRR